MVSAPAEKQLTATQISRIIRENKHKPLKEGDVDVYEMVKSRMWWDMALFESAFPEDGTAQAFMVKIWAEAVAEIARNEELMQEATNPPISSEQPSQVRIPATTPAITPAASILQPVNSNIPYKVIELSPLLLI